jgi:general secretion pathway protein H
MAPIAPSALHRNSRAEEGYSLVELLTVLAILTLLTAVTGLYLKGGKPFSLRLAALDLASCLRMARAAAIAEHKERVVAIDLERRSYACPRKSGFFPKESRLLFRTAASEYVRDKTAFLRFFADGGATGGHVFMEEHGQIWAVRVNWLSGSVEAARETSWPEH